MHNEPQKPVATTSLDIDAALDDVWHALTTDDGLALWMGEGATIGSNVGDDLILPDPTTGAARRGVVGNIDRAARLEYTWWPANEPDRITDVAITLEPCDLGTRVTVIESIPSAVQLSMAATTPAAVATSTAAWVWRAALLMLAAQHSIVPALH